MKAVVYRPSARFSTPSRDKPSDESLRSDPEDRVMAMGAFPADSQSWPEAGASDPLPTDIEIVRESSYLGFHGPAAQKAGRFDNPVSDALDQIAESPVSNCKVGIPLLDWDPQGFRHQALTGPALQVGALVLEYLPQEVFANGRCQDSPGTKLEISSKISLSPEAKTPEGPHLETGPTRGGNATFRGHRSA